MAIDCDRLVTFSLNKIKSVDEAGNLKHSVLSLNIERGNFEHSYSGIGVKIVSACEWAMDSDWMYREPISDSSSFAILSGNANVLESLGTRLHTTNSPPLSRVEKPPFMNITLMNPEPMNLWTVTVEFEWDSEMKDGEVPSERIKMSAGTLKRIT